MARLEYQITGDLTGLNAAAGQVTGILNNLQAQADKLRIKFFQAEDVQSLNAIGGALTIITSKINDYTNAAIKGSAAFQDQQVKAALDTLSTKISVLTGNAQLFGETIKNNQSQINAYQTGINSLLSAGLNPFDSKVTDLKSKIDALTSSIENQKAAAAVASQVAPVTPRTLGLIEQAEKDIRDLTAALKQAGSANEINTLNQKLNVTTQELRDLRNIGNTVSQTVGTTGKSALSASAGINSFNLELGRIVQDAPFAANNFGAIGNNITRAFEVLPQYRDRLKEVIIAQGGTATSGAILKQGLSSLFTGFSGLSLGLSLAISAFTIYQQYQQKAAREAQNHTSEIEKQKKALEDYIATLNESSRAAAAAANTYGEQRNKLEVLSSVLLKNKDAIFENKGAFDELKTSFPQYLTGITQAQIGTEAFTKAIDKAKASLRDLALANASIKLANDAATSQIQNQIASQAAADKALAAAKQILAYKKKIAETPAVSLGTGSSSGQGDAMILASLEKNYASLAAQSVEFAAAANKASKELDNFNNITAKYGTTANQTVGRIQSLQNSIEALSKEREALGDAKGLNATESARLDLINKTIKADQEEITKLEGKDKIHKTTVASLERQVTLSQQLQSILSTSSASASASGLTGYAAEVERINAAYKKFNDQLTDFAEKVKANKNLPQAKKDDLLSEVATGRGTLAANQSKELTDAAIAEATRAATEIQRINDEFGVKATQGRDRELASIQKTYDAEIAKAGITQGEIEAIQNGRLTAIQAVNEKYQALAEDLQSKISTIEKTSQAESEGREETATQRIKNEYDRRLKAAQKYYDELRALVGNGDDIMSTVSRAVLGLQQGITNKTIKAGEAATLKEEDLKPFTDALNRGVKQFGNSFANTISNIGEQSNATFGQIFSNLEKDLNRSVISTLAKIGTDYLGKALQKGITNGTGGLADLLKGKISLGVGAALAAAGIGALVSGVTPKTSSVGQGLGGALSGAATGAALGSIVPGIGTAVGAVAGGIIGAIGGLFGASKARKEQAAQAAAQLEESRKQTALLRQQALAYTSSVIGRMTTQGVVTGVDVNEFGQLTATVSGKDLQFVLDRNAKSR